jgi:hypothetical protein
MQTRILKIAFLPGAIAAGLFLFAGCTTSTPSSPGVAVFHTDTLHMSFTISDATVKMDSGVINMNSVRNSIGSGKIDTSSLVVSNITISLDPADTASAGIVKGDSAIHLLTRVYYSDAATPWTLFLQTQDSGSSISRLATEFIMNRDLFGVNPGYSNFGIAVQDPTISELGLLLDITPLQTPAATGTLKLIVVISEAAKVKT